MLVNMLYFMVKSYLSSLALFVSLFVRVLLRPVSSLPTPSKFFMLFPKTIKFFCGLFCSAQIAMAAVSPHPNVTWSAEVAESERTHIQIAADADFSELVDRDVIDQVARYVPDQALAPGAYYWRVKSAAGKLQQGQFVVDAPEHVIEIPLGSGMAEIRAALQQAQAQSSTLIRFEPGHYDLHPAYEGTVFDIEATENLIIDGQGASFDIHAIARLARVRFSKHITLRNFTADYAVPIYTAARVDTIAADGTLELTLWPGCVPPESVPRFMEEQRGLFSDPTYPRMAQDVPLLVYMKAAWESLGENRYRLQAKKPSELRNVKTGMVYICAPRYQAQGIEIYNTDDITFADVTTYYLPGIGVVTNFAHDLKLIRLQLLRREDRLLGVQNGGTNLHGARIGPWVEGCRFENTGDDNNHISSLVLTPLAQPKPNEVVIDQNQPGTQVLSADMDIRVGDRLAFFQRLQGTLLAEATVVSATVGKQSTSVVLDRELPELKLSRPVKNFPKLEVTQVYNLSRACGNFVFRNNSFVRGRRIGILLKSGPGLVENNEFRELGAGGIEIWNAPFEGLHAHDVLIQNNRFVGNGVAWRNLNSWPAIWSAIFGGKSPQPLHRNIRILNNEFVDCAGPAMHMADVDGLVIEGNRITNPSSRGVRAEQTRPASESIATKNVRNASVSGNAIEDFRFSKEVNQ
jgi:hypothetical protein